LTRDEQVTMASSQRATCGNASAASSTAAARRVSRDIEVARNCRSLDGHRHLLVAVNSGSDAPGLFSE